MERFRVTPTSNAVRYTRQQSPVRDYGECVCFDTARQYACLSAARCTRAFRSRVIAVPVHHVLPVKDGARTRVFSTALAAHRESRKCEPTMLRAPAATCASFFETPATRRMIIASRNPAPCDVFLSLSFSERGVGRETRVIRRCVSALPEIRRGTMLRKADKRRNNIK